MERKHPQFGYEILESVDEVPNKVGRTGKQRVVAGSAAAILGAGSIMHAAPCATPELYGSVMCGKEFAIRHDPHTESGGNTSSSSGVSVVLVGTGTSTGTWVPSVGSPDWVFVPKSS